MTNKIKIFLIGILYGGILLDLFKTSNTKLITQGIMFMFIFILSGMILYKSFKNKEND